MRFGMDQTVSDHVRMAHFVVLHSGETVRSDRQSVDLFSDRLFTACGARSGGAQCRRRNQLFGRLSGAADAAAALRLHVECGGRYRPDNVQLLAKRRYDPRGLLNPGKMVTFEPEARATGTSAK